MSTEHSQIGTTLTLKNYNPPAEFTGENLVADIALLLPILRKTWPPVSESPVEANLKLTEMHHVDGFSFTVSFDHAFQEDQLTYVLGSLRKLLDENPALKTYGLSKAISNLGTHRLISNVQPPAHIIAERKIEPAPKAEKAPRDISTYPVPYVDYQKHFKQVDTSPMGETLYKKLFHALNKMLLENPLRLGKYKFLLARGISFEIREKSDPKDNIPPTAPASFNHNTNTLLLYVAHFIVPPKTRLLKTVLGSQIQWAFTHHIHASHPAAKNINPQYFGEPVFPRNEAGFMLFTQAMLSGHNRTAMNLLHIAAKASAGEILPTHEKSMLERYKKAIATFKPTQKMYTFDLSHVEPFRITPDVISRVNSGEYTHSVGYQVIPKIIIPLYITSIQLSEHSLTVVCCHSLNDKDPLQKMTALAAETLMKTKMKTSPQADSARILGELPESVAQEFYPEIVAFEREDAKRCGVSLSM